MSDTTFTLITGASMGIGEALARISARNHRNLILAARSEDKLQALADELKAEHGIEAVVIPADLAAPDGASKLWAQATEGRKVDFLINNAGLGSYGDLAESDWEREKRSIDVNVMALTELCKLAVPHLLEQGGGRILNVASLAAYVPGPRMAIYHATKSYVLSFSVALNEELKDKRITVTAFNPGVTQTNFQADANMKSNDSLRGKVPTAMAVAEVGYGAAIGGRAIAIPGPMNNFFAFVADILPRPLVAILTKRALRAD